DINTVPVFFDHRGEAADLAFDPLEPLESGLLDVLAHSTIIYPYRVLVSRLNKDKQFMPTMLPQTGRDQDAERLRGLDHDHPNDTYLKSQGEHLPGGATAVDPVCGMTIDPASAKYRIEQSGASYFFCGANCQAKFV